MISLQPCFFFKKFDRTLIPCGGFLDLQFSALFVFYKMMFYKNVEAEICEILRIVLE